MADEKILTAGPSFMMPEADQGSVQAATSGFSEGFRRSVGGTLARTGQYLYLREMGKTPLTKQKYDTDFKGLFKYEDGMTEEEAEVRREDHVNDTLREQDMSGHPVASMVGNLPGSMANPFDLVVLAAAPEVKLASWANATGKTGSALLRSNAARVSFARMSQDMVNMSANGVLQNAALEIPMYAMDEFLGRKHGLDDTALNVAAGFGMGLGMGAVKTAWRAYSPDVRQSLARAALRSSLNGEGADPIVGALGSMDPTMNQAAKLASQATGEQLKSVDTPENIDGPEAMESARQTGYVDPEVQTAREAAESRGLRAAITKSNAGKVFKAGSREEFVRRTEAFKKAARNAVSDDELLLDEAFNRIFGTRVKFVDNPAVLKDAGLLGLFSPENPGEIFVRSGDLDDAGINMLRIAGHEMGHVIRARDPHLWLGMVDTMLNPETNKHFSKSWLEVRSAKKASELWKGMTYHERMDETLATVLGHAMQTPDFWVSLNKTDAANGRKLAGYLLKVHDTVAQIMKDRLGLPGGARVHAMEKQLAKAVSALDESGKYKFASKREAVSVWERSLNGNGQPAGSDKKPIIFAGYSERRGKFRSMEQTVYDEINAAGLKEDAAARRLDGAVNALFPDIGTQVGSLRDNSAMPSDHRLVAKHTKAVRGDPRNYLVKVFFKNLPDTQAQQAFLALSKRIAQKYNKTQDFLKTIMELGPLATYKQVGVDARTGDPLYEFNIYTNDKNPMWSELRVPEDFEIDDVKMAVKEHYDSLAKAFSEDILDMKKGKHKVAAAFEIDRAFTDKTVRAYLDKLSIHDLIDMSTQDLIDGFHQHLDKEMHNALQRADESAYDNLVDLRNEGSTLPPVADDAEKPKTLFARVADVRQTAKRAFEIINKQKFEDFDESKNYLQDIEDGDVRDLGLTAALDVTRAKMFEERIAALREEPELEFMYENMTDAQRERFHDNLRQEIDRRIYDTRPKLREAMSAELKANLIGHKDTPIMVNDEFVLNGENALNEESDWLDNAMVAPLDEVLRMAKDAQGERKAESDAAVNRSLQNLRTQHERYNPWLTDVYKQTQKTIPDLLKRNNLIDFEVEDTPLAPGEVRPKPPERSIAEEKLLERLSGIKKSMNAALKDLDNIATGSKREGGKNAPETDYNAQRFQLHMGLLNGDRHAAADAARADIKNHYTGRIYGELRAHEASAHIQSTARKSFKHLFSWLDGQARAGVKNAGESVDARRHAQAVADLLPLDMVLARYGLRDHWINNSLVEVVLKYIETGEAKTPEVKLIGDTLRQLNDMQAGRINSLGGAYRMLDKFAFSQTHNGAKIAAARDAWTDYLLKNLDWERTEKFVGKFTDEKGKLRYLDAIYENLMAEKQDGLDFESDGGNVLSQTALRRTLHFQPGKTFEYDMTFGSGNTGSEIMSQIVRRAEKAAFMDAFGPKPKVTWGEAMTTMGVQFASKFSEKRLADETFHHLIGTWDNPIDKGLASTSRALRNYANSAALWFSGISSITDIGNIVSTLRWAGMEPKDLHARVLSNILQGVKTEDGRIALQGSGAGMQSILSAYTRILGDTPFQRMGQKLSDFTFKYSGTEMTTRLYQEAMHDFMSTHLGEMAGKRQTPEFTTWLEHYGITPTEWKAMSEFAGKVEGLEGTRLAPDMILDPDLALKLRSALHDTTAYGQLQPSVSDEALLRFGTRAGTVSGEAVRLIGQYKGYPLAVLNKVRARFRHAYGTVDAPIMGIIPRGRGLEESMAWTASMLVLAYLAIGIKDALRGNEPLNPFEKDHWTWGNATRIMGQAGAGPVATVEQFSSVSQALGPVPGAAYRVTKGLSQQDTPGGGYRATEAVFGALPGASIGFLQEARRQAIGYFISDAYMTALESARTFREGKTGQNRMTDFSNK